MITRIWSGGQTGADRGGLDAGLVLGLETGGYAPRGFRTERGPAPELADYGLAESNTSDYAGRTRLNIHHTDGTVVFGNPVSPGSALTIDYCCNNRPPKPVLCLNLSVMQRPLARQILLDWIGRFNIQHLNVAGNRESVTPGIQQQVMEFLVEVLGDQ